MARKRKQIVWERSPVLFWIPKEPRDIRVAVIIGAIGWWAAVLGSLGLMFVTAPGFSWQNLYTVLALLLIGLGYSLWPRKVVGPGKAQPTRG